MRALVLIALGAACEMPHPPRCALGCGPAGECPQGMVCLEDGICHDPGDALCGEAAGDDAASAPRPESMPVRIDTRVLTPAGQFLTSSGDLGPSAGRVCELAGLAPAPGGAVQCEPCRAFVDGVCHDPPTACLVDGAWRSPCAGGLIWCPVTRYVHWVDCDVAAGDGGVP